ncbi:unnamed protein product [Arctogadus glacialis]
MTSSCGDVTHQAGTPSGRSDKGPAHGGARSSKGPVFYSILFGRQAVDHLGLLLIHPEMFGYRWAPSGEPDLRKGSLFLSVHLQPETPHFLSM